MNKSPKVSIITISYNNLKGLERTIKSVLKQTYQNIEFILIDGASNDGTDDLLKSYSKKVSFWISEKDKGIADAFNKGLKHVTGDCVFFLNSGDVFVNDNVISNVASEWEYNPVDVLFYKVQVSKNVFIPAKELKDDVEKIWNLATVPHQGAFINSEVFKELGGFNTNFEIRMDYEFFARCKSNHCTYKYVPETIVSYEAGGKSMLIENRKKFWKEGMSIKHLYNIPITYKDMVKAVIYR
ncbi:glycosyltransferase family 2 protein [Pontibacillus marinus]|uniref:Colanic acid biosynthesis glycosyl transferase n=1 Tax=Pontibacillus marinus BH030004 = DSM 16465 TaxID=1385511 RepID=A0A0A5GCT6_9BACI|nr:glycosyltransferase family 2 protein [Pontibacillus marinus]KGX90996.1 colanic acid biosynthesis glycosyl transferase [Pontibacillus marinus BH030004 = DSM 16465]